MKVRLVLLALFAIMSVAPASAQNPSPEANASFDAQALDGVWRGQMDGMPGVNLILRNEGGALSGAIVFYLHTRKTVNDPYTSTAGIPEPIFNLHFDGKTLRFQVSHRHAHPPATLSDPPVWFQLTLLDKDRAGLIDEAEAAGSSGPGLSMTKSDN